MSVEVLVTGFPFIRKNAFPDSPDVPQTIGVADMTVKFAA